MSVPSTRRRGGALAALVALAILAGLPAVAQTA
jgi:hypothetical protein